MIPPPPWYDIAHHELGTAEVRGKRHNPRVLEYLASCKKLGWWGRSRDETPWCSAYVNWCLHEAGYPVTNSAAARSWLTYGRPLAAPELGAIVVFSRPPKRHSGHVGFVAGWDRESILVMGGNQGNEVSLKSYPAERLLGYRWVP